ncbi:serine-rich adhesin for platelets-like isoform X1 [Mytilus californianus]|uniref:serine-rich adhesin for platelets-like isoform X1 n=1 Tax=Mytilus californianus TaxID=6549 RepID=UPI0022454427|nr:serine-rich adhesin for platelets-like isoform X1 [Mytilus californianus]
MPLIQIVLLIYTAVGLNIRMSRGEEECWALVYKISTGGNGSAYNLFMSGDSLNVNDEEAMSLHCSNPSRKHFKSDIVNNWSTNGIDQVRVSVYVNGIEQIFLLFNGSKTNKTNWFDESRLMNSSYSDLNEQTNVSFFSVDGISGNADDSVGNYSRRFYIRNETTGNCETSDYGWLFVGDELGNCDYERKIEDKPFILFSNPPYISKALNHTLADSLAIFIKFSSKANCLSPFVMNRVHENSQCITDNAETSTNPAQTLSTNLAQTSSTNLAQTLSTNPAQTSSTSPAQTSSTNPAQTSSTSIAQTSSTNPAQTSSTNPTQTTSTNPTETSSTNPAQTSSTNPAQTSSTSLAQTSSTNPAQTSSTNPTQTTSTNPTETSSTNPAQTSSTNPTTIRSEDLQNKIDRIKMELTVQRKSTQKYKRSLTSAPDERKSSKIMGIIGATVITSVIGFIVLMDCSTCKRERKGKAKKGNN